MISTGPLSKQPVLDCAAYQNERLEQDNMYLDNTIPVGDSVVPNTTERNVSAVILASDSDSSTTTLKKPIAAEHADRHSDRRKPSLLIL